MERVGFERNIAVGNVDGDWNVYYNSDEYQ